ncbi:MAG: methyltransferase domain-containing protein [Gammaproteobacteria bacterium]|nr:methyltransferase domain-containing protein [Gammaproteobacteria bacterium]
MIFSDYAEDLVSRVSVPDGATILEIAAGTGVLTECLANRLPSGVIIIATDLNSTMLDVARENLAKYNNISFNVANAIDLHYNDDSFDVVLCQFGVMFFPDLIQAYREVYRVLKPGGEFMFNVWDSLDNNHFSRAVHESVIKLDRVNPPDFLKLPYGYHNVEVIKGQLEEAGFRYIGVDVVKKQSRADSARDVALALAAGSPLATQLAERGLSDAVETVEADLLDEFGEGEISAPMQAKVFHAVASS